MEPGRQSITGPFSGSILVFWSVSDPACKACEASLQVMACAWYGLDSLSADSGWTKSNGIADSDVAYKHLDESEVAAQIRTPTISQLPVQMP